jgi:hypothetical protein
MTHSQADVLPNAMSPTAITNRQQERCICVHPTFSRPRHVCVHPSLPPPTHLAPNAVPPPPALDEAGSLGASHAA